MTTTPTNQSTTTAAPIPYACGDQAGRIEVHGIDIIPDAERHGRPKELFKVWAAANVNYMSIVLGGTLVLSGLSMWQAFAVVLFGNAFWALVGYLAISGPASGTASTVITRAMFGIRANRVVALIIGWAVCIAYEAINLALGSLAAFALVDHLGVSVSTPTKVLIVGVTAAVTLAISVYGHATIVKVSGLFTIILTVCTVVLGYYILTNADFGYVPAEPLTGSLLWASLFAGLTIIASAPLSWSNGADYARYLSRDASPRAVASFTALGGFVPAVLMGALGVLAGTVVDMTNPQVSLQAILPGWFYPVFLAIIAIGAVTNNVLTMYSSGLSLQSIGVKAKRSITVAFDGVLGVA